MSSVFIDAGITHIKIQTHDKYFQIVNDDNLNIIIEENNLGQIINGCDLFISGKLATIFQQYLNAGKIIESAAALWARAKVNNPKKQGVIDISASGFMLICVDNKGKLVNDLLVSHPKCGAGTGINLMRILQKLDLTEKDVDPLLIKYLGENGKKERESIPVRVDRCGVFSSSATISDKNQGIPLEHALAVTIKSEVLKATKRMIPSTDRVILTGGVFLWQFARDCGSDYLKKIGVNKIIHERDCLISGMQCITNELKSDFKDNHLNRFGKKILLSEYPSFKELKQTYEQSRHFKRLKEPILSKVNNLSKTPVNLSFDIGSTMAKLAIEKASSKELIYLSSFENNGDTIETIKHIFRSLKVPSLNIQQIGITGSGRYQVKTILEQTFSSLKGRIFTLVENYAHARGSIDHAKEYLHNLPSTANKEFCVLVDIGGEDTKLSTISLDKEELFDNVMNIKCSAGTGSLMDTLKAIFGISEISKATQMAYESKKAYEINATCAVFLMENAQKMQTEGYGKDEILASCNHAIVENMARTLWNQVDLPKNAVVLLHGQTMLSDPLPLAVTHRIQDSSNMYCLIPPFPGHRACIGLLKSLENKEKIDSYCDVNILLNQTFSKKIIVCHGVACGDKDAKCSRTLLLSKQNTSRFTLGGCTAINELTAQKTVKSDINIDAYKDIWNFVNERMPISNDKKRLIIPRMFAVSHYSFFFAKIFEHLGIPVHVDNVKEKDILSVQSDFSVDVCAPFMGATGQLKRLSKEPHGIIFVPQIDYLPTGGQSVGKTCTVGQGGATIARNLAERKVIDARFVEFDLSLKNMSCEGIVNQLIRKITPITDYYHIEITTELLEDVVKKALADEKTHRTLIADKANEYLQLAIKYKRNVSVVCAREYILNPGVYDSHVGRLLKDKHVVAIPSYALQTNLDKNFGYVYWKNSQDILTKVQTTANGKLHEIIVDKKLQQSIEQIEMSREDIFISTTQVSTFRCGPDSVTVPMSAELTKHTPSLFIQSDGMIKELAHLENRVNTHINQLEKKLHESIEFKEFDFQFINSFGVSKIDKEYDVVYLPTMHDNIATASALRASGITVIDNFNDETYDLEKLCKIGRKYAGDSICAPFASVLGDFVLAREDFLRRKKENDLLVEGKNRVLVFDAKGEGPCRQGQYFEVHKLLLSKHFADDFSKLVVGGENENYNIGLESWALIQGIHGLIIKDVLSSLYIMAGASVKNYEEFESFDQEFKELKTEIYTILETKTKPNEFLNSLVTSCGSNSFSTILKYFVYGLYNNNGVPRLLSKFSEKWHRRYDEKISIHIGGEFFMRAALTPEIFKSVIDIIGFRTAKINISPIGSYFESAIGNRILDIKEDIDRLLIDKFNNKKELAAKQKEVKSERMTVKVLRNILTKPLYKAAGIELPETTETIFNNSAKIFPSLKPQGELIDFTGKAIHEFTKSNTDLLFNVLPEGCLVSAMGQAITPKILDITKRGHIEYLSTLNGELDKDKVMISLLKSLGPLQLYAKNSDPC